ncbi:hypothetical protein L1887_14944 [Cichorium endivia]|nr:hypothetical protein L1887_14944 [Cichorium endivia]
MTAALPILPAGDSTASRSTVRLICSYLRDWDYTKYRQIADKGGTVLMCDMAQISGLIAAKFNVKIERRNCTSFALLYASKELDNLVTANFDQKIGVQIIQNALKAPVHTIAANAGVEGVVIVGKLPEQDNPDLGYDAAKGSSFLSKNRNE